ncbi:MAG: tRNA (N(6)-L-threonylcarbamoyladenosine(37)-C(2))-methylthiotransferase MtaB [Bacillota bacterium]|nr:tRNA (N(6)-L-threonylcarbamoyladenosine(37)-C(2))-methylthiotransferase MtaB [Bacillota bacterium]
MATGLTFAIETLGCKTNLVESDAIADLLVRHGHRRVEFDSSADAYIINTCTVTQSGDKKSRQLIRRAKKQNPNSTVIVMGCYSQLEPEEVAALEGVDHVLGTANRSAVLRLLDPESAQSSLIDVTDIMEVTEFEEIPLYQAPGHTRAFIKIQEGCEQYCTYCIIPYARGKVRSRSLESIVQEVARLSEQGFSEFVLTGIHIGSYGKDFGGSPSLLDVIEELSAQKGVARIRLGSIEPRTIDEEFVSRLKGNRKLCDHFHLSLQSGSDPVLKRMNRKYRKEEFRAGVARLKTMFADPALTTDIIVGFPGETEEQFEETMDFVREIGFSDVHVFPYSPRKGTPAANFSQIVPADVKKIRAERLRVLAEELGAKYRERFEHSALPILIEKIERQAGLYRLSGYTSNYLYRTFTLAEGEAAPRIGEIFSN